MKKFTALGANVFAGLFSYGVRQAGYELLGHLEHGPYGVATAKLNFPKLDIRVGREHWHEQEFKSKVDFMYCNPPCAAWSTAANGRRGGWETQIDRLRYVHDCVDAGLAIRPKAWCWESVTNAWRMGQPFMRHQAEKWNDAGYHVTVLLQDNQYLGAPQIRQRVFLIAHQHPLVWPKLTEPRSVRQAFAELKGRRLPDPGLRTLAMQPLWAQRLWKLSDHYHGYFRKTYEVEGHGPKQLAGRIPSVMVRRLSLDKPAPVMMAASLRLHPTECRYVNWHEWLTLVGLPLEWQTAQRSLDSASMELGRAVLPAVGRWLGNAVKAGFALPKLRGAQPTTRVVDLRKPDARTEAVLFEFEGFTTKPIVPPPLPLLTAKPARTPSLRAGGPSKPGSGVRIRELILKGVDADSIVTTIHQEFPGSKASKADVSWNRGRLRREGKVA